ncbi:DUF4124 domain-containing protein [Silvimonas iriomotensis]|uniref:DUF4124 domain-containing protein n=1 Tax=Silvimonas iriomotensis TaxID=449662 RepID=A0ABQ2PEW9_9NEIS|nr:DUF4124 domain-containing protein [Silvimonas iriomotensis]GGP24103.1 hypothetical protein GCM10010970_41030 [Silvimonas iriomotensis]
MRQLAGCLFAAGLALNQLAEAADVYKCQDDQGKITYGQTPCHGQKRLPYEAGSVTTIEAPPRRVTPAPTPEPAPAPVSPAAASAQPTPNPQLPAGDNCNMDNPAYDPVFCQPNNLRSVYGNPTDDNGRGQRLPNLPRVNPLPGGR